MNEKTAAYSSLLAAVEALAEDSARARLQQGRGAGEITEAELASIADQFGRKLTPPEVDAVKAAFAAELARG